MANLPSNRTSKEGPSVSAPALIRPASSPITRPLVDCSCSSRVSLHKNDLTSRITSSTTQSKAPGKKACASQIRRKFLKSRYRAKAPPYIWELSELFSAAGRGGKRKRAGEGFCGGEESEETSGLIHGGLADREVVEHGDFSEEQVEEEEQEKKVGWGI